MAFETERNLLIKVVSGLPMQPKSMDVWLRTCFPQILTESGTYTTELHRKLVWGWVRELIPDRYTADSLSQTFWKILSRSSRLFTPEVSPQKAATSAVHEHLTAMSALVPMPVVSEIRWVPLENWHEAALYPGWRARYDAALAGLRGHSDDMQDLWRQLAFAHIQNVSEPRYSAAYKWFRPIWVQALWEVLNGAPGMWCSILRVAGWGYLPVGLAEDGQAFIVSSRLLP